MITTMNKRRVYLPFAMKDCYRIIRDLRNACTLYNREHVVLGNVTLDGRDCVVYEMVGLGQRFWMPLYHTTEYNSQSGEVLRRFESGVRYS